MLREVQPGVLAALLAGFGAIISEVGAAMLVGGNIDGQTRVLSTADRSRDPPGELRIGARPGRSPADAGLRRQRSPAAISGRAAAASG